MDFTAMTTTISICGSGTMGRGIALSCIQNGYTAYLYDIDGKALDQSIVTIKKQLMTLVEKGKISGEAAQSAEQRLFATQSLSDIAKGDIIIEAIIENLQIKNELFSAIEQHGISDNTIFSQQYFLYFNKCSCKVTIITRKFFRITFFQSPTNYEISGNSKGKSDF